MIKNYRVSCHVPCCGMEEVLTVSNYESVLEFASQHWFRCHKTLTKDLHIAADFFHIKEETLPEIEVECQAKGCYLGPIFMPDDKATAQYIVTHMKNWGTGHLIVTQRLGQPKRIVPWETPDIKFNNGGSIRLEETPDDEVGRMFSGEIGYLEPRIYGAFDEMTSYDEEEYREGEDNA